MISPDPPDSNSQEPETAPDSVDTAIWTLDSLAGIEPGESLTLAWTRLQVERCRSLEGDQVLDWYGWRMALRETGPDGQPQFDDPAMPFLQCTRVFVRTLALGLVFFDTDEDQAEWGIFSDRVVSIPEYVNEGIYREDDLDHLPTGKLDKVEVFVNELGNIDRIMLSVEGWRLWLVAAEAYEQADGSLKLMDWDESIFLFTDEQALKSIRWENAFGEPTTHHSAAVHEVDPSKTNRKRTAVEKYLDALFRRWCE